MNRSCDSIPSALLPLYMRGADVTMIHEVNSLHGYAAVMHMHSDAPILEVLEFYRLSGRTSAGCQEVDSLPSDSAQFCFGDVHVIVKLGTEIIVLKNELGLTAQSPVVVGFSPPPPGESPALHLDPTKRTGPLSEEGGSPNREDWDRSTSPLQHNPCAPRLTSACSGARAARSFRLPLTPSRAPADA